MLLLDNQQAHKAAVAEALEPWERDGDVLYEWRELPNGVSTLRKEGGSCRIRKAVLPHKALLLLLQVAALSITVKAHNVVEFLVQFPCPGPQLSPECETVQDLTVTTHAPAR